MQLVRRFPWASSQRGQKLLQFSGSTGTLRPAGDTAVWGRPPEGGWAQGRDEGARPTPPPGPRAVPTGGPATCQRPCARAGARRKLQLRLESAGAALKIPGAALQGRHDLHPASQNHPPRLSRERQTHTCRYRRHESVGRASAQPAVRGPHLPHRAGASQLLRGFPPPRWARAARAHRAQGHRLRPQAPPEETKSATVRGTQKSVLVTWLP